MTNLAALAVVGAVLGITAAGVGSAAMAEEHAPASPAAIHQINVFAAM